MKRYTHACAAGMVENEEGRWVKWDEVKCLLHENTLLKEADMTIRNMQNNLIDRQEQQIDDLQEELKDKIAVKDGYKMQHGIGLIHIAELESALLHEAVIKGHVKELELENAKLREALHYYAQPETYYIDFQNMAGLPTVCVDNGKIARKALKGAV